jgi:chloride channel protein, CIC family
MSRRQNVPAGDADGSGNLFALALLALIVGAAAGFVGAVFRLALEQADRLRDTLIAWAHGEHLEGFLIVVGVCAAATLAAASLVRRFSPYASGSGIPHVEAVLNGELPEAPFRIIPVKFGGGVLAIGAGLALGREGPSVQMGATMGRYLANVGLGASRRGGPRRWRRAIASNRSGRPRLCRTQVDRIRVDLAGAKS